VKSGNMQIEQLGNKYHSQETNNAVRKQIIQPGKPARTPVVEQLENKHYLQDTNNAARKQIEKLGHKCSQESNSAARKQIVGGRTSRETGRLNKKCV
jgi:hypothetical protein